MLGHHKAAPNGNVLSWSALTLPHWGWLALPSLAQPHRGLYRLLSLPCFWNSIMPPGRNQKERKIRARNWDPWVEALHNIPTTCACVHWVAGCLHPLPCPCPFSKARCAQNKGANSVCEQWRGWAKWFVFVQLCPWRVRKEISETHCFSNATLPRLSLRKSAKSAQLAPSLACSDVYGMDRDIFSASKVPSLLLRLGQLPEGNFSDQTSDIEKPSL